MLNISKAKQKLNFKPKWNSERAIENTFKWYLIYNNESINANKLIESDLEIYLNTL